MFTVNGRKKLYFKIYKQEFQKIDFMAFPICEHARLFCCIAKQNYLDQTTMKYLEKLGYEIIITENGQFKDCNP
jgi:hypothetical protein